MYFAYYKQSLSKNNVDGLTISNNIMIEWKTVNYTEVIAMEIGM